MKRASTGRWSIPRRDWRWGGSSRRIGRLPPAAPTIVTNVSSRIKGLALIPIQDTEAALQELRRAVKDLRMVGAMLPSNGEGIKGHFGSKIYWPIYEETEKFGCPLAVRVGSLHHLGMIRSACIMPSTRSAILRDYGASGSDVVVRHV